MGDYTFMVFTVLAGFVIALVASRYFGDADSRISGGLTRSKFSRP
jgi:hypothetical protein